MHIVRTPDGIVTTTPQEAWEKPETIEVARENIAALIKITEGNTCALLMHLPNTYLGSDISKEYVTTLTTPVAVALISNSFASKVVGNLALKIVKVFSNQNIPTRIFSQAVQAKAWLLPYIEAAKQP